MAPKGSGPWRSESIDSTVRPTRVLAAIALIALAGGLVSDSLAEAFWARHALLAGLASSVIVVMFSVAIVNEILERRNRRRWTVLAQYVMLELVRNARLIWTGVLEITGTLATGPSPRETIEEAGRLVRDNSQIAVLMRDLVDDSERRRRLHAEIDTVVRRNDEVLGRWAAVMVGSGPYAEIIDRHVELATNIAWLSSLLDGYETTVDDHRRRKALRSAAAQIEGEIDDDVLARRLVTITQLAEELDRGTLEIALRIVPVSWRAERLGISEPPRPPARVSTQR